MSSGISEWCHDIYEGDAVDVLEQLPGSSVHASMTSPPYFGLRDYGVDGQIGREDALEDYIENLVAVGEELRRVLRPDGSWWLNLGDSFHEKDKQLVPHRVAIRLQEAGWIVRGDCPWIKPNPMPQSSHDRFTEQKEFVFHLVPDSDYWFDLYPVRESHSERSKERLEEGPVNADVDGRGTNDDLRTEQLCHPNGKNPGDVLRVETKPFPDSHFAVFPEALCERPIKASVPPTVCARCGTPYERVVERTPMWERDPSTIDSDQSRRALELADEAGLTDAHFEAAEAVGIGDLDGSEGNPYERVDEETAQLARETADALGSYYREACLSETEPTDEWEKACDCNTDETEAGILLDPFAGSGTALRVAKDLGRRFVGVDLNPEYVALAQRRVGVTVDEPERLLEDDETALAAFADGGGSE